MNFMLQCYCLFNSYLIPIVLFIILVLCSHDNFAQGFIGLRVGTVYMANPKVINPSPATITTNVTHAFETAIEYTYMGKKRWGFTVGGDFGAVNWSNNFNAPLSAFGTKQGPGEINSISDHSYLYNSAMIYGVYNVLRGKNSINVYAGPGLRFHQTERTRSIYEAYNRIPKWDRYAPNSGPADLNISSQYDNQPLKTNVTAGFNVERKLNEEFIVFFGIRGNVGFKTIDKAEMEIIMNDQKYHGSISSRPDYFGVDLAFRYRVYNNKIQHAPREESKNTFLNGSGRKVLYVEAFGNGLLGSANFDMRFAKDRNDGLGFRVGLGMGELHPTGRYTSLPLSINYVLGKRRNGLEAGIGITPQITLKDLDEGSNIKAIGFMNIGYRMQPLKTGLVIRAMLTPAVNYHGFYPAWGGLSLGYGFQ